MAGSLCGSTREKKRHFEEFSLQNTAAAIQIAKENLGLLVKTPKQSPWKPARKIEVLDVITPGTIPLPKEERLPLDGFDSQPTKQIASTKRQQRSSCVFGIQNLEEGTGQFTSVLQNLLRISPLKHALQNIAAQWKEFDFFVLDDGTEDGEVSQLIQEQRKHLDLLKYIISTFVAFANVQPPPVSYFPKTGTLNSHILYGSAMMRCLREKTGKSDWDAIGVFEAFLECFKQAWDITHKTPPNTIQEIFQITITETKECSHCFTLESETRSHEFLSLPIPQEDMSIQQWLVSALGTGDTCPFCGQSCAVNRKICQIPDILVLRLPRFRYDLICLCSDKGRKLNYLVTVSPTIYLQNQLNETITYQLLTGTCHDGDTRTSGLHKAIIPYQQRWVMANDMFVRPINLEEQKGNIQKTTHLCFYQRQATSKHLQYQPPTQNSQITSKSKIPEGINTLLPGKWINDDIIEKYLTLVMAKYPDVMCFPPTFNSYLKRIIADVDVVNFMLTPMVKNYCPNLTVPLELEVKFENNKFVLGQMSSSPPTYLRTKIGPIEVSVPVTFVQTARDFAVQRIWTQWGSVLKRMASHSITFFPLNPTGKHWVLCVLDRKKNELFMLNPLETFDESTHNGCLKNLEFILNTFELFDGKTSKVPVPQQPNTWDCGPFICQFARSLAADRNTTFQIGRDIRARMAKEIQRGKLMRL